MKVRILYARCTKCGERKNVREMVPVVTPTEHNGISGYSAVYDCKVCTPKTAEDVAVAECVVLAERRANHRR